MATEALDYGQFPILVVDDERDNLDAFRFNFQRMFSLHLAEGGDQALELARAHDVAVVVTDQRMPRMTSSPAVDCMRATTRGAYRKSQTSFVFSD